MTSLHRALPSCTVLAILLGSCTAGASQDDEGLPAPERSPRAVVTPAGDPSYSSDPEEPFLLPRGSDFVPMSAGRYEAWRIGSSDHYEVDVPDGWRVLAGTYLNAPADGHGIFFVASLPRKRTDLAVHPCRDHTLWRVGPTVRDFAEAMRKQPVWRVSTPRPVALDGHQGLYVEVELPARVDPARCVDGAVSEYESGPDGMATTVSYKGRWWILDVHGQRLVVMARCYDTCTQQDLDTMTAMAESISWS